jgi:hypothetical protein
MEQVDTKEIEQSRTPESLYSAIEKYSAAPENSSLETAYREAQNALIRFRKLYSKLPAKPNHQENPSAGLQEVMDWCVRSIDIIDHMVDDMDRKVIDGFISKLNKLKGLPASGFPKIHKDVWKKAEDRAQRICDKYQTGKKRPRGLDTFNYCSKRTIFLYTASIVSSLVDVADRKAGRPNRWSHLLAHNSITTNPLSKQIEDAYTKMGFYRAVEKIYRLMDSDYTAALAKIEERISVVFEEWNKLNDTTTGDMLNKYDELKGIKLQDRVVRLKSAYSIDSIVDTALFGLNANSVFGGETRETLVDGLIETLHSISRKIKEKSLTKQSKKGEEAEGTVPIMPVKSSRDSWQAIKSEYDISKRDFSKKINFVSDSFKRKIILRDVEHAFVLASQGFPKPAIILAGGVIEELLRQYLKHKDIQPKSKTFVDYIKACEDNSLLKRGVSRLTDSIRDFRNLVHLDNEETKRHTVSKATAKGAVASIFTIVNDFQ